MPSFQETIAIDAAAEDVWAVAGDPGRIADWLPAVTRSQLDGAERHCTLENGAELNERILEHSDADHSYVYEITGGPLPVTSHRSRFAVDGHDGHTHVEWTADFETEDPAQADEVYDILRSTYRDGLEALRTRVEGRAAG